MRHVLDKSDLYARDGKSQHAFCIDIDREGDVRVLCNVEPNERWMDTMLHEFGHGIYDPRGAARRAVVAPRAAHPLTTEGVAMLFGRLARDPEWLTKVAGVSEKEVDDLRPRLDDARRAALLTFARWVLVVTHFEQRFYADPEAISTRSGGSSSSATSRSANPTAATLPTGPPRSISPSCPSITRTTSTASSSRHSSMRRSARVPAVWSNATRPASSSANDFFGPGASLRWDHLVEQATGTPLTAAHLASALA